jgi:predicted PhzF superfamily epimerase YddE/YHI9
VATAGVPLVLVDSFALPDRPFTGNPAAVCLLEEPADGAWMQQVGAELHQAATAFVWPAGSNGAYGLRWFTATSELTLCGHGTLAAAHALWERGDGADRLAFRTPGGPLAARRQGSRVGLAFPAIPPRQVDPPAGLPAALGGAEPRWVGSNDLDLFVELGSEDEVRSLRPDQEGLARLDTRGVVVTAEASDPTAAFVSRYFAPRIGIPEDHATGSAHCGLGPFWAERFGRTDLTGLQLSPRGGVIEVRMEAPGEVTLVGLAVTVMRGTLVPGGPRAAEV